MYCFPFFAANSGQIRRDLVTTSSLRDLSLRHTRASDAQYLFYLFHQRPSSLDRFFIDCQSVFFYLINVYGKQFSARLNSNPFYFCSRERQHYDIRSTMANATNKVCRVLSYKRKMPVNRWLRKKCDA